MYSWPQQILKMLHPGILINDNVTCVQDTTRVTPLTPGGTLTTAETPLEAPMGRLGAQANQSERAKMKSQLGNLLTILNH